MLERYISQQMAFLKTLRSSIGKTAVILPSAFMMELGINMANLGLIFYMRDVQNLTPAEVGWFAATWLTCYVVGCILMRPIMGQFLPRYGMIASSAIMCVCLLLILIFPSVVLAFILYGLYGLAMSFFWPPLMGWLAFGAEGSELGKAMGRLSLAGSLGIVIGPLAAGTLSEISPVFPAFAAICVFFGTCMLITGASLTLPRVREDRESERTEEVQPRTTADRDGAAGGQRRESGDGGSAEGAEPDGPDGPAGVGSDTGSLLRYPAWIGLFGTCVVSGVIINIFPMYARIDLGITKSMIGALLLCRALGTAGAYLVLSRTSRWHFRPAPMIAGLVLVAACALALPWARSVIALAAVIVFFGPLHALAFSYSFFHGLTGSTQRSRRMALHEALLAGGIITGSIVGGVVYHRYSIYAVSLFCALLAAAVITGQVSLVGWARRREGGQPARPPSA